MAASTVPASGTPITAAAAHAPDELLLLARLGDRPYAIPTAAIIRILPMAAPTALPEDTPDVIGVLAFRGATLPVIDPRPRLGLPTVALHPDQYLVAIAAGRDYFLWIDRAEEIVTATVADRQRHDDADATISHLIRREGVLIPVLAPEAFVPTRGARRP